jgi:hypothetical protein
VTTWDHDGAKPDVSRSAALQLFDRKLEEILEYHIERFYSKRIRSRAEAGPGLFGQGGFLKGGRGTDYWTMDYAKENIDFCLHDVAKAVLDMRAETGIELTEIEADLRRRLRAHFDGLLGELKVGTAGYRHNEYGLQPPHQVYEGVVHHINTRLTDLFGGLNRGVIDPRLLATATAPVHSGKWILLALMIVLIVLVLWN